MKMKNFKYQNYLWIAVEAVFRREIYGISVYIEKEERRLQWPKLSSQQTRKLRAEERQSSQKERGAELKPG